MSCGSESSTIFHDRMDYMDEEILEGGSSTDQVVRIGDTVHRSVGEHSEFIHELLLLLEEKNYPYAPRYLGMDEQGREILTYVEGDIAREVVWTNENLIKVVRMIKEFHDATTGTTLAGNAEVVCHRDLSPWNLVIKNNEPISFIDFDGAEPGNRVEDLAYFLWTFLELGDDTPVETQVHRIKMLCDEYGFEDGRLLMDTIIFEQKKIVKFREGLAENSPDTEVRDQNADKAKKIKEEIKWMEENRGVIEGLFA